MRIDAALAWASNELEGGESPSIDAKVLLSSVLNQSQTYLFTWPDKLISESQLHDYKAMVLRRKKGEPVAYITGSRDFWSLTLATSPHTLIPRPDTEVLIEHVLAWAQVRTAQVAAPLSLCDLGTGTGAIALSLASELPKSDVIGVDFLEEAVVLAKRNAQTNNITNALFIQSDWFSALEGQVFDAIVSNPPYIELADPHLNEGDVRFEPKSALTSGEDGLDDIKRIVSDAPAYLKKGGLIAFEHGFNQGAVVRALLSSAGFSNPSTYKDYGGNDRVTLATL